MFLNILKTNLLFITKTSNIGEYKFLPHMMKKFGLKATMNTLKKGWNMPLKV